MIDKIIPPNILNSMNASDRAKYAPGQLTMVESGAKAHGKLEKYLHDQFINYLHLKDLDYCHARPDKKSTIEVGRSDFLVWHERQLCFVEFKADWGRLSEGQKAFIARQQDKGTPILVTKDLQEAINFVVKHLTPWNAPQNATPAAASVSPMTVQPEDEPT
jgi:hypothetical protein